MEYYNHSLLEYVRKIQDVERELFTTQELIADLEYQANNLCHPKNVEAPDIPISKNPFVENGGWYFAFLLCLPLMFVFRSFANGAFAGICMGIFGTIWGSIRQESLHKYYIEWQADEYNQANQNEKERMAQELHTKKQLRLEIQQLKEQENLLMRARTKLYAKGSIHESYRSLIPISCFAHYLSTGITNRLEGENGCYDRFDQDAWKNAVLKNLQQAVREIRSLQQINRGLYQCLSESNATLQRIENGNSRIEQQMEDVRSNTELAAYNSRVTAIASSAMTYMYADQKYRS